MMVLKILLYVCAGFTGLAFLISIIALFVDWYENGKCKWYIPLFGLFIIPITFYIYFLELREFVINCKKAGGMKNYLTIKKEEETKRKEWARRLKMEQAEYDRITKLYKKGKLKREELPRCMDGIKDFEFEYITHRHETYKDLIYIENEYNENINRFFLHHYQEIALRRGLRVVYLPLELERLKNRAITDYLSPNAETSSEWKIDYSFLLDKLCYPEDAAKLEHGILTLYGGKTNHGALCQQGTYYRLEEGDDEQLMAQINAIAKEVFEKNTGGCLYSIRKRPTEGEGKSKDYADSQFSWEINNLVDEIRERIEKLEQHGISRALLQHLLREKSKLSRLVVTKDYRIVLPDYNNMEIKMEPLNKAVYLLFLKHPNGIKFKHLPDYRKELTGIYAKLKPYGINDKVIKSIEDVTNPCLNSINEKCARIRGAFVSQFDEDLAKNYYIYGFRGEEKKISLPHDLIVWE